MNPLYFSPDDLSYFPLSFSSRCINCHVGGSTLPNPKQSLALDTLKGVNPSRDNVNVLVSYMRRPMTYNGSEETCGCR